MPCCSAIDCSNTHEKGFRMFCFPQEETRRKQWIHNVHRKNWNPTRSARLCELHFEASQFESHRLDGVKKIKPNAVPTLFSFSNPPERINSSALKSVYEEQNHIDASEENTEPLQPNTPDQTISILDSDSNFDPDEEEYEEQTKFEKTKTNNNETSCEMAVLLDHEEDKNSADIQTGLVQCNHCNSTFLTFDECEMHMKLHKVDSEATIDDNSLIEDVRSEKQTHSSKNKNKLGSASKHSYPCPIDYCTSISSTAVELEKHIQVHGFTRKFSADLPQVYLTQHDLLLCIRCGLQTIKEFPMRVHRLLNHHSRNKSVTWICPKGSDCFQSSCRSIFIKHLQDFHQLNKEDYTHQVFGELKMMDYQPSTATGKVFDCHFCEFSTRLESEISEHVPDIHPKRRCNFCETMMQGEFQIFWHTYTIHKNITDYNKWRLRCTICSFENLAKHSYQHGGTHKNQIIKFKTIFQNEVKGIVPFLYILEKYAKNAEALEQIDRKAEGNSDIDTLDLADSDTHKQVPEIFSASDKETSNGNDADLNFPCKSCHFATKNRYYLSMHQQIYHKRVNQTHFFCPQPNCTFESQYRSNFRRHLLNTHEIDVENFQISNENVIKPRPIIESLTCEKCNFEAGKSDILSMHVQLLHSVWQRTEADPFWCPMENCMVTSPYKSNFKRHLIRVHHVTMDALGIAEIGTSFGLRHEAPSSFKADNDDFIKGNRKFTFKKHIQKQMEVEGNQVSNEEFNATKSKTKYECSETNFDHELESSDQYLGRRSDLFWSPKFSCPFEGCSYVIGRRLKFKRHLTLFHNWNDSKLQEWKGMDYFIAQYAQTFNCLKCGFDGMDMNGLKNHFSMEHKIIGTHSKAKPTVKKNSRSANRFLLKCTKCTFATNLKSSAHLHGFLHFGLNKKRSVIFRNYVDCKRQDDLVYRYPDKNMLKCPKCNFRGLIARDLRRHMLNVHSLRARNHLSDWNIRITKQRMERRKKLRQKNQKNTSDINEKEICEILVTQNNNDSALKGENNEVIKILLVDDADDFPEQINSNSENLVTCTICEKQFLCKADLLIHINAEHILMPTPEPPNVARMKTGFVPPSIEGKVSFICCLCKQVLFCTSSLKNHTSIHSKAANNSNLRVTFTKFKGDLKLNKVTIKADPNYVPRKSSNVSCTAKHTPKDKHPVLDYSLKLKVFSCEECNFKTNEEDNLTKHKKLHWSNEKEEIYKSKKWFTCKHCSYYSFDAERFEKHAEMHKISANLSLYVD
ncbi:unnamed protein product [Ceutorhynchus assimilis]|uniref:Uncharacterized protein n=1 Tax=Ceutorhynchus assimilis TaxID=467358 RepID=A0A9N9MN69_9CUCU|nr:unnamed protein product [Ceutorhynchus assimilis]